MSGKTVIDVDHIHCDLKWEKPNIGTYIWDITNVGDGFVCSDSGTNCVFKLDKQGNILVTSHEGFEGVRGLAYHPGLEAVLVCDQGKQCIFVLDPTTLKQTRVIGNTMEMKEIYPESIAVLSDGNIVLLDFCLRKVQVFGLDGRAVREPFEQGIASHYHYISADSDDNIYIPHYAIHKVRPDGQQVGSVHQASGCHVAFGMALYHNVLLVVEDLGPEHMGGPHFGPLYLDACDTKRSNSKIILQWERSLGYGQIRSVAVNGDVMVVAFDDGLRGYKLSQN